MNQSRSIYRATAANRDSLSTVATIDACAAVVLIVATQLQCYDIHSVLLVALQIPHIFTPILATIVVHNFRYSGRILDGLFVIYWIALAADFIGSVLHGFLAYNASTSHWRRTEIIFSLILIVFVAIDVLGALFLDQLRHAVNKETQLLQQFGVTTSNRYEHVTDGARSDTHY